MGLEFKELDVRPILAAGGEPFQAIMAAVEELEPGQGLTLLAPFQPQPLYSVMQRMGFLHQVNRLEGGEFEVRFSPRTTEVITSEGAQDAGAWPEPTRSFHLLTSIRRNPWSASSPSLKRWRPGKFSLRFWPRSLCSCFRNW